MMSAEKRTLKYSALHSIIISHLAMRVEEQMLLKDQRTIMKNANQNGGGPVGPAAKKSSRPDIKNAGLGPAGPL